MESKPTRVLQIEQACSQAELTRTPLANSWNLDDASVSLMPSDTDTLLLNLSLPASDGFATLNRVLERTPVVPHRHRRAAWKIL